MDVMRSTLALLIFVQWVQWVQWVSWVSWPSPAHACGGSAAVTPARTHSAMHGFVTIDMCGGNRALADLAFGILFGTPLGIAVYATGLLLARRRRRYERLLRGLTRI